MTEAALSTAPSHSPMRWVSDVLVRRRGLLLALLLTPPLLWLGVIYLGALFALLAQSVFSIDEFSGTVSPADFEDLRRALLARQSRYHRPHDRRLGGRHAIAAIVAFPIAYYAARYAHGRTKALFYVAVMMPLWSSYLVKVYAWKLLLAKEAHWLARAGCGPVWRARCCLDCPLSAGPHSRSAYTGSAGLPVHVAPFMILPVQAALERVPVAAHRGQRPGTSAPSRPQTFRHVILPLAVPGVVAGSIFTFSLTLGDYIVPQIVGPRRSSWARWSTRSRVLPETFRSRRLSPSRRSSSWACILTVAKRTGGVRCPLAASERDRRMKGRHLACGSARWRALLFCICRSPSSSSTRSATKTAASNSRRRDTPALVPASPGTAPESGQALGLSSPCSARIDGARHRARHAGAAALARAKFFGREAISLLFVLPIALPGIVTGIALRSAFNLADISFSFWTIVLGHATFCIVVVYNNAIARFRRLSPS